MASHQRPTQLSARSSRRTARTWALIAVLILVGVGFAKAGEFLVVDDPFEHADVALVLSGLPISRAFAARDLYAAGRVDQVWVIPEPPNKVEGELVADAVKEELIRLKLLQPHPPQIAERILTGSGVPRSKVVMLPRAAHGTILEALQVQELLNRRTPASLVLITSKSASRRARLIFRHVLRRSAVRVLAYPTPYDAFESRRWWRHPRNALTVVMEYQKLLANAVSLALGRRWE